MTTPSRLLAAAALTLAIFVPAQAAPEHGVKNIVLVHGAFADGSGWKVVSDILTKDGYNVSVAQPPETSLEDDVAATNRLLDRQDGTAILVGHSYGGAIITEAGNNAHVKALVYVAAFQPDAGESVGALLQSMPPVSNSIAPSADGFLYIAPEHFHADFAADLPQAMSDFMARSQVGLSVKAVGATIANPAWKTKPSYAIVAKDDHSINPALERSMYKRSGSITTEVSGSHAIYISQAKAVAEVIEKAANAAK
jgi:pimeloyl-ACP methyl ester carboxylesterase